jgi:hypothetical protein
MFEEQISTLLRRGGNLEQLGMEKSLVFQRRV